MRVRDLTLLVALCAAAAPSKAQTVRWENRGQPELTGAALELAGSGSVIVAAGDVGGEFDAQWFVRGVDRGSGATLWEDRFGPVIFGIAKDLVVEGNRAFVAGWIFTPGRGFEFVVRAYDVRNGAVLWSRQVSKGPQCAEESPHFARCVAKALDVRDGRVFVVGHLTRTASRSDFAVLAFDAQSGVPLWESVTDPTGTGSNDYAWAVSAVGDSVFVLGETGNQTGLLLQSHDARTGAIQWRQQLPGALNFTLKGTLAANRHGVFISGIDADGHFFVQAYDTTTGVLRWADRVDEAGQIGEAVAVVLEGDDQESRLFATGVVGCDPDTFLDCELAVRAYDPVQGLVWYRADVARGGDWNSSNIAVGGGRVYVGGNELLEDGLYHPMFRSYSTASGEFGWSALFDDGNGTPAFGFTGFVNELLVRSGRLFVSGNINRSDGGVDLLVRMHSVR